MVLRHDSKAWDKGFKAGETSPIAHCPYYPLSLQAWSWHSGFIEGDAKRRGYSYSRGALFGGTCTNHAPNPKGPVN